jgi:hydroxymethylglutaryl-CoA lyase
MTDFEIYEVGPRDGLQSRDTIVPTANKVQLIEEIANAGIRKIEVGSIVNPDKVPNMADSDVLFKQLPHLQYDCELAMLVPNRVGVEKAKKIGVENFNVFFSPSESFNMNNHGKMSSQVFTEYCTALDGIPKEKIRVYLSCIFGSPYTCSRTPSAMPTRCQSGVSSTTPTTCR